MRLETPMDEETPVVDGLVDALVDEDRKVLWL